MKLEMIARYPRLYMEASGMKWVELDALVRKLTFQFRKELTVVCHEITDGSISSM